MKPRKKTEAYAVLSLSQIRQLLAIAEADAKARYGDTCNDCATVILRGHAVTFDGKLQCHLETADDRSLGF